MQVLVDQIIKLFKDRHIMTGIDSKQVDKDVKRMEELLQFLNNVRKKNA